MEEDKSKAPLDESSTHTADTTGEEAPDTSPAPAQVTTPVAPPTPTSKRHTMLIVSIVVLVVALIAAAAVIAYVLTHSAKEASSNAPTNSTSPTATTSGSSAMTAEQAVALVDPIVKGTDDTSQTAGPAVKVAGYDFYVAPVADDTKLAAVVRDVSATGAASEAEAAGAALVKAGFTARPFTMANGNAGDTYTVYTTPETVCSIGNFGGYTTNKDVRLVTTDCYDMSNYQILAKNAQPFVPLYSAAQPPAAGQSDIAYGDPTIKNSPTSGYKTAEVSMGIYVDGETGAAGGFAGLFYQTPDGAWHFFKGTQEMLECSAYNTTELQKAYAGQSCYDSTSTSGTSTVKVQ